MAVPDLQIKSQVRAVLTRHWIDLTRLSFDCCRGSVRFRGEISFAEGRSCSSPASLIDALEFEIERIPGVKSVYLMGVRFDTDSNAPEDKGPSPESRGLELSASDLEITIRVRAVLNKHRIDLNTGGFDCCRGSVCFRGEISLTEGRRCSSPGALLETLKSEIEQIPGVKNIYLVGVTVSSDSCEPQKQTSSKASTGLELTVSDLEIERRIHAVLDEHGIDLQRLELDCCGGTLSFRGRFCFVDGRDARKDGPKILDALLIKLKLIPGVRQVYFIGLKFGLPTKRSKPQDVSNSRVVNARGVRRHT